MKTALGALTLAIGASSSLGAPADIRHEVVVNEFGAGFITEIRETNGPTVIKNQDGRIQLVTEPRWEESDQGADWIAESVAAGDHGASVIAGKYLNSEGVTLYPSGTSVPVFHVDELDCKQAQVAMSDRANLAASYVVRDMDGGGDYDYEATISVYETSGDGTPLWTYTFPRTLEYFGGGVAISDNGSVVLAWKANPHTATLLVEAFDREGNSISSNEIASGDYFNSRQTRLSDDGSRAYFNLGVSAIIYDVATASILYEHNIGGSFDSHAFSGDGETFAYGFFGYYRVYRETSPGNWTMMTHQPSPSGTFVGQLALNQDGSRVAYSVQRYTPNYDHFEFGLYDVDNGDTLFSDVYEAPGTEYQLVCMGLELDDAGDYLAGISLGDSFNLNPEGFVYQADGTVTCEIDSAGSAFGIGFDADGDVFAMGTKAVHGNQFGRGGSVICADAYDQELHLLGTPQLGGSIQLEVPGGADSVIVSFCTRLGTFNTPYGEAEIDVSTELRRLGPIPIPGSGLSVPLNIPNIGSLAGRAVHAQALIIDGNQRHLTNKVSLRILP